MKYFLIRYPVSNYILLPLFLYSNQYLYEWFVATRFTYYIYMILNNTILIFFFSVQMLRSPTRHYSNLPKNIKVTSWRNIRNTILSTASSSFLCLSIIMVFLQWLVSKQLLLGFFSKFDIIYLYWTNTSVNKNNNKMKEGTYNGLQSSYNNGKKCITFMFMDRR